ncbi:MAG: H-NS family nucleoid-associated regulatory protein [Candidatus Competibacterales bacterium]
MAKINLDDLTSEELRELHRDIEKEIQLRHKEDVHEAVDKIQKLAEEVGMPVEKLLELSKTGLKPKGSPKYQNPANPKQTWTGKGKRPNWFKELIAQGVDPATLLITDCEDS